MEGNEVTDHVLFLDVSFSETTSAGYWSQEPGNLSVTPDHPTHVTWSGSFLQILPSKSRTQALSSLPGLWVEVKPFRKLGSMLEVVQKGALESWL